MKHLSLRGVAVAAALACAPLVQAQPVLDDPTPEAPLTPAGLRDPANPSMWSEFGEFVESLRPIRWGSTIISPHPSDKFIYSDGLYARQGSTTNSYINRFAPGFLVDFGDQWTIDYTPTWVNYTNKLLKDSLEHSLKMAGGIRNGDWLFQASQIYRKTNSPDIETGGQTGRESSTTRLNASHLFTNNLSIEINLSQTLQFIERSPDSYDWSMENWLTYRFASDLEFSGGFELGYTDFDPGSHMEYTSPQVRVRWRPGTKLSLQANVGYEYRRTATTGIPRKETPTFGASIFYRLFDQTRITLRADRSVSPSFLANSTTDRTSWNANVDQRLFGHYTLSLGGGRMRSKFVGSHIAFNTTSTTQNVLDGSGNVIGTTTTTTFTPVMVIDRRTDSTSTYRARLTTPFLNRGTLAFTYQVRKNDSDASGFSFSSHQTGVEVSYRF